MVVRCRLEDEGVTINSGLIPWVWLSHHFHYKGTAAVVLGGCSETNHCSPVTVGLPYI
jgi:hypothetical protein